MATIPGKWICASSERIPRAMDSIVGYAKNDERSASIPNSLLTAETMRTAESELPPIEKKSSVTPIRSRIAARSTGLSESGRRAS